MIPRKVWIWSITLSISRFLAFYFIYSSQSHDAQWQLSYFPLWIVDFPISFSYFVLRLPIPLAEAVIGPIWWFLVPIAIFLLFKIRKNKPKENH